MSEKPSPFLSVVVCTQHQSLAFRILRVDPDDTLFGVNMFRKYQNFGFLLNKYGRVMRNILCKTIRVYYFWSLDVQYA